MYVSDTLYGIITVLLSNGITSISSNTHSDRSTVELDEKLRRNYLITVANDYFMIGKKSLTVISF